MTSDLAITDIICPPTVTAPCATTVKVVLQNSGPDPAPFPIGVCLDVFLTERDDQAALHMQEWLRAADDQLYLQATGKIAAYFRVSFPCVREAWLAATADCPPTVVNNARSVPSLKLKVSSIVAVPWLFTRAAVGICDSLGTTTWDPPEICPTSDLVVKVDVENRGCLDAPATVAELTLLDDSGQMLLTRPHAVPPILAGSSQSVDFRESLAAMLVGQPARALTITVCADTTGVAIDQCDLSSLCVSRVAPVRRGANLAGPAIDFYVHGSVVPGQSVSFLWWLRNDCSDLGLVTATVRFNGSTIYTTINPIPTPLQGQAGQLAAQIPRITDPAVASDVYKLGQHSLELTLNASGANPGPYLQNCTIDVVDHVSPKWWSWPSAVPAAASWRVGYLVGGFLTNNGLASIASATVAFREVAPASLGSVARVERGQLSIGSVPILPGTAATFTLSGLLQSWEWTQGPTWDRTGPISATFSYAAEFDLIDEYGNVYPSQVSPPALVNVSVSGSKLSLQMDAQYSAWMGVVFMAAGVVFSLPVPNPVGAGMFAIGWGWEGIATWKGAMAQDPPLPDFNYLLEVHIVPPETLEYDDDLPQGARTVGVMLQLAMRSRVAEAALLEIHAKVLGARIDDHREALQALTAEYYTAAGLLSRAASALESIAAVAANELEYDQIFASGDLQEFAESLRRNGIAGEVETLILDGGYPQEAIDTLWTFSERLTAGVDLPATVRQLGGAARASARALIAEVGAALELNEADHENIPNLHLR
jgi:hypothetical protein